MRERWSTARRVSCTERTASRTRRTACRNGALAATLPLIVALLLACGAAADDDRRGAGDGPRADTSASTRANTGATRAGSATAKPICPATGAWQPCNVVERLDRAGLAPTQQPARVTEPPLSSPGVAIILGKSELRVFFYADRAARERDQAKLDNAKYISPSDPASMRAEPTIIASENLLAILRSQSDHQRERVSDALTAGPPQRPGMKR